MIKNTRDFPIIAKYFYVMDFSKMLKPRLIPLYFLNRNAAKRAIKNNVKRNSRKIYSIFRGKRLIGSDIDYILKYGRWGKFTKYDYHPELTIRQKKVLRTQTRRRLRRMKLYSNVKARNNYYSAPAYVKLIKNRQKVANSPKTTAKAIQLERKPSNIIYLIAKKLPPRASKFLVTLKVVKINIKTGDYSYLRLNIHKTDIIIPFLLKEAFSKLETLPTQNKILKICKKKKIWT